MTDEGNGQPTTGELGRRVATIEHDTRRQWSHIGDMHGRLEGMDAKLDMLIERRGIRAVNGSAAGNGSTYLAADTDAGRRFENMWGAWKLLGAIAAVVIPSALTAALVVVSLLEYMKP